jgi:hypothetical protein
MNVFFLGILAYLLYRFVTGFLIPVFRTTRHVRQQFSKMNGQPGAEHQEKPGTPGQDTSRNTTRPNTAKVGEYIDFEEVK